MTYQILAGILITALSYGLLAADLYMVKAKTRFSPSSFSRRVSLPPIQVQRLNSAEVNELRQQNFLVEKNAQVRLVDFALSPDVGDSAKWPGEAMKLAQAHALPNSKGQGQTVCVVDTGVDKNHPMIRRENLETYNAIDSSNNADDEHGHGTFVASLIAGTDHPSAAAPEANLLVVKALDKNGGGTVADVVRGIEYCAGRATVINLSLGASVDSEILRQSIRSATAAGATVVAAVANNGDDNIGFPASYNEVIAVASVDENLQPGRFSSRGDAIDIAAPGVTVMGALAGGQTVEMTGNSMATGFVSGVVALQKSRNSLGLVAVDLGFSRDILGSGLINAYSTAINTGD